MKEKQKARAITLRKRGYSYCTIAKKVKVSKSTLSLWLSTYPLNKDQIQKLKSKNDRGREKFGNIMRERWNKKRTDIYNQYIPPYDLPLFMIGLGLYMGEGTKYNRSTVALANCDPVILKIFQHWIGKYFSALSFSLGVQVHSKSSAETAMKYWKKTLKINKRDVHKPIVSISRASKRKRNTLKYGTAVLTLKGKGAWATRIRIQKAIDNLSTCLPFLE